MLFTQELCLGACCEYIFTQPWKVLPIRSSCVLCCAVLCCAVLCCACCRNERGCLVAMTGCDWSAEPVQLRNGSTIGVASWYSGRTLDSQGAHPWHEGVMGLGFVGVVGHLEEVAKTFLRPPSKLAEVGGARGPLRGPGRDSCWGGAPVMSSVGVLEMATGSPPRSRSTVLSGCQLEGIGRGGNGGIELSNHVLVDVCLRKRRGN
jgi:hypothetical protein